MFDIFAWRALCTKALQSFELNVNLSMLTMQTCWFLSRYNFHYGHHLIYYIQLAKSDDGTNLKVKGPQSYNNLSQTWTYVDWTKVLDRPTDQRCQPSSQIANAAKNHLTMNWLSKLLHANFLSNGFIISVLLEWLCKGEKWQHDIWVFLVVLVL